MGETEGGRIISTHKCNFLRRLVPRTSFEKDGAKFDGTGEWNSDYPDCASMTMKFYFPKCTDTLERTSDHPHPTPDTTYKPHFVSVARTR